MDKTLIVITGPTAVGKTRLCIDIAKHFGIPIINAHNNRSFLNVSAQWVSQQASANMIDVNSFRINIGITFNERWFQKWKVE